MVPGYVRKRVGGLEIALLDAAVGEPVLLLHGFTLNARSWRHQWQPLVEAGYRPIAPDNPGFGDTPLGPGFMARAEDYADLHDEMLTALGVRRPVPVIGHSLGGGMALFLAASHPHRVSSLVVVAPASEPSHSAMRVARVTRRERFGELAPCFFTRDRLRRIVLSGYGPNPPPADVIDDYTDRISVGEAFGVVGSYFSRAFLSLPERYGSIDVPALIVAGELDPHNPHSLSERPAREIPGSRLEILPGLAHCPHEEDPDSFNPLLLEFLSGVPSAQ